MKTAERVVMVLIVVALLGGVSFMYYTYHKEERELREAVARGEYEIPINANTEDRSNWRTYYPEVVPIIIGTTTMYASVADSMPELIKGLSDTPYLPAEIVKLFAFGTDGRHSIWMKDMNYALDIVWLTEEGKVVHIVENVSPDTYPEPFKPPVPARYVIEGNAGMVASTSLAIGDEIIVPKKKQ